MTAVSLMDDSIHVKPGNLVSHDFIRLKEIA